MVKTYDAESMPLWYNTKTKKHEKYGKLITDVLRDVTKQEVAVIEYDTFEALRKGYTAIRSYIRRNELQKEICVTMMQSELLAVYRIALSKEKKQTDLLYGMKF